MSGPLADKDRLRVALVGCGVMGTRHAERIAADPRCDLLTIDFVPQRAESLASQFGGRALQTLPSDIDAAVIATPTATHAPLAAPLLERGIYCLVEKPLAETPERALSLVGPRCAVGHVERFNPALRGAGAMRLRSVSARRLSPPCGRGLDVDVVFDLMIHDLDLLFALAPDEQFVPVSGRGTRGCGGLLDIAEANLRSSSGLTATLLASRVALARERTLHCVEHGRQTTFDLVTGRAMRDGQSLPSSDTRDALTAQWESFVDGVTAGVALSGSAEAQRAVALAQQISMMITGDR